MPAGTTCRAGTMSVRSSHGRYFRAPAVQAATHSGAPPQRLHLWALVAAPSTGPSRVSMSQGQASTQMPQPWHLSWSTTRALTGSITSMAPCGQASWQGTGCGHWRQVSPISRKLPKRPSPRESSAAVRAP